MAVTALTDAEVAVRDQVGTIALLRAKTLLLTGMVHSVQIDAATGILRGVVEDGGPLYVEVNVGHRHNGHLDPGEGWCGCGALLCEHVAALLLSQDQDQNQDQARGAGPKRPRTPAPAVPELPEPGGPAPWERALTSALSDQPASPTRATGPARSTGSRARDTGPAVALQFEITDVPGSRIAVRLVVPGKSGGWVRSNVTWASLAHPDYYLHRVPDDQLRLLRELHSLPSAHHRLAYEDRTLMFDAILSRRVWDLLQEVQACGIPLVMAGREAGPVQVLTEPVTARLLVRQQGDRIVLEPAVEGAGQRSTQQYLPIADPAHGVAWRPGPHEGLRLARLKASPPPLFWQLSAGRIPPIPAADTGRFLTEFYPRLAQQIQVLCPDGSLDLPQAQPPVLELTVTPLGDHRMQLDWAWAYRFGDSTRHEPLQVPPGRPSSGRDLDAESHTLAEVTTLLSGLTQSWESRLIPAPRSTVAGIDTARLMSEVVPQLRQRADVEVKLAVDEDQIPDYREVDQAPVLAFAPTDTDPAKGQQDWFDLSVSLTMDGHAIPFGRLFVALAQEQPHLMLDNGIWFSLDRQEFHRLAALIAESRELLDAPADTVRLSRFSASAWEEVEQLGVVNGQVESWRASVRALSNATQPSDLKLPAGLDATLRPYQEDGFRWLATLFGHQLGGILADDMGLGKTLQTLALFLHAREQGLTDRPFLVVAPTSVVTNWTSEAARFTPGFTVATIEATTKRRRLDLAETIQGADLVITSYTLFRLEFEQYREQEWAGLVLDEAQTVKNHAGAGHRCARELPAPFKLAITGTPMENNLMELWSLFSITAPGLFPRPDRFTAYYRTPIERQQDPERLDQLRRRIAPLMLRRTKDLVAKDLPERQEQVMELELAPKHRTIYQKYLQRERQKVLGLLGDLNRNRFEIFRSLTLLRQATLDVGLVDPAHNAVPSTKLDALMDQVSDIAAEGHRVLVFSQFTRFLGRAADRLEQAGIDYTYLDGKTTARAAVISQFRQGSAPVFLISLKAGGSGLNLTEADYVVLLDPWWNPAVEAQAVDRAHRIGQTRNVMVYRMVAKDTIEEKVMALKARKSALTQSVLDGEALGSSALTADDIRTLLS